MGKLRKFEKTFEFKEEPRKKQLLYAKAIQAADKYDRPSVIDKIILRILRALKKEKPKVKTTRTKAVESGLRRGGLTEAEIKRLRRKK